MSSKPDATKDKDKEKGDSGSLNGADSSPDILVVDLGSGTLKVGWAGEDAPRLLIPTLCLDHYGQALPAAIADGSERPEYAVGHAALQALHFSTTKVASNTQTNSMNLVRPIVRGDVVDWDTLQKILEHIFKHELRVNPKDHPLMLAVPPLCSSESRAELARLFFEVFCVPSLCLANQAVLSLFSTGRTTGLVLEAGEGMTYSVPIYEGFALRHAITAVPVAGLDLTRALMQHLATCPDEKERYLFADSQIDVVRDVKERLCRVRVSKDIAVPPASLDDISYELPSGDLIVLGEEGRWNTLERLFTPHASEAVMRQFEKDRNSLNNLIGVQHMISSSLSMCDLSLRKELQTNIVLAGGTSMATGFGERMRRELENIIDDDIVIVTDSQRKYAAWIGASMYASLPTFNQIKITAEQYKRDENIVHKKFF